MKLYSRKNLILGLICCLCIIFEYKHFDGGKSVLWIAFFAYTGFRCIRASFSKEAYEQEEELTEREKRVMEQMGPLWRIPALVILAPPLAGAVVFSLVWPSSWGNVALFLGLIGAIALGIRFRMRYNELMEQEKQTDEHTKS